MVTLYSTNCPKCKVIEKKLKEKEIEFELITDVDRVVGFGQEHNKNSAPILVIDDNIYDFVEANRYLNSL